ncbi:hypothetical protein AWB74_01177 [Caballeronia arvi]|uniref:Purine nucleoside phosphorylase n=1 Tax=Caballeronia arvi TaxID=1777135 RepID=A0A158G5F3_9BURK|nr:DUF4148 domain-containing protein [Caballeronia arvi]SAL27097.1 hypothetical protein AWB74_01177 [Caballeronia arvi]
MNKRTAPLAIIAMSVAALVGVPVAQAQDTAAPAAAAASTPKQVKKAERKAARAKKNAELKELEKNGYNPAGDQTNYPQNLQNAQSKINAQKAGKPAPASAP